MLYNGEFPCPSCEHLGETCQTGYGHNKVFPMEPTKFIRRTVERMSKQAEIKEMHWKLLNHFRGVKGRSIASKIPYFDTAKGFPHDYMHAVLLGVMKMLLVSLWFDFSNQNEDYYIGRKLREEINKILEEVTPPDNITRAPRSL